MLDFIGTTVLTAAITISINAHRRRDAVSADQKLFDLRSAPDLWMGLAIALRPPVSVPGTSQRGCRRRYDGGDSADRDRVAAAISPAGCAQSLLGDADAVPDRSECAARLAGRLHLLLPSKAGLTGPFRNSAGWGDVIIGVSLLPVAWLAARTRQGRSRVCWHGMHSGHAGSGRARCPRHDFREGSPLQIIRRAVGSRRCSRCHGRTFRPCWCRCYLIVHAVVFARLASFKRGTGASQ